MLLKAGATAGGAAFRQQSSAPCRRRRFVVASRSVLCVVGGFFSFLVGVLRSTGGPGISFLFTFLLLIGFSFPLLL